MSILDSFNRNIKNIFVGSHKGEDIKTEWLDTAVESVSDFLKGAGFEFDEITLIKNQSQKTSNKSIYNESVMVNTFNDD